MDRENIDFNGEYIEFSINFTKNSLYEIYLIITFIVLLIIQFETKKEKSRHGK